MSYKTIATLGEYYCFCGSELYTNYKPCLSIGVGRSIIIRLSLNVSTCLIEQSNYTLGHISTRLVCGMTKKTIKFSAVQRIFNQILELLLAGTHLPSLLLPP